MEITFDTSELEALADRIRGDAGEECIERSMKKFAQYGLRVAKRNTPVGETNQLRKSWNVKEASASRIVLNNPTEYAECVEYGHRQKPGRFVPKLGKRLVVHWVPGQFFAKRAGESIDRHASARLGRDVRKEVSSLING